MLPEFPSDPPDLAAWRTAQRRNLIDKRAAAGKDTLESWRRRMDSHIERAFPLLFAPGAGQIISICWPHRNEYDARPLAARWRQAGSTIVLPVVLTQNTPLIFREWIPGMELAADKLGIPYPPAGAAIQPGVLLLPVVGFDSRGYRLGYGGGYFDRTLAAMTPRPLIIGTAYELSRIETVHPQAHDVPMDWVVTEAGVYRRESGTLILVASSTLN
jgi:5-formyltetrahydrofolate cyclo-ligase